MKILLTLLLFAGYFSTPCWASLMDGYEVVNFKALPQAPKGESINSKDVEKIVPYKRLNNDDDVGSVGTKILDQSVNSFLQSDYVQSSSLGKTAKSVEDGVKTDIAFGSKDSKIKHKISLQYQAFQQEAQVRYKGLMNFDLKYNTNNRDYTAEIVQNFDEKQFVIGHELVTDELDQSRADVSTVSMRWKW